MISFDMITKGFWCKCGDANKECMVRFNMLRGKAYSSIYWHKERST